MSNIILFPARQECRREREYREHMERLFKAFEDRRLAAKPDRDPTPPEAA